MKKTKIGIIGAGGRMGQEIRVIAESDKQFELLSLVGREDKIEKSAPVDVWIDFSTPDNLKSVLKAAVKTKTPVVCGTTGLGPKHFKLLEQAAQSVPVLWSSNMSLGVAVLNEALKTLASIKEFDFQIEEIHHKHKKDRPSGTALTLQKNLERVLGRKIPETLSVRGGGVFGVHKVFSISDEEMLTFEHTALNRKVFARGALKAAVWLKGKKKGFYEMKDVLFS